jgi:DNA-binding transcriptional MerR regulator
VKAAVAPIRQNGKTLLVGQLARLAGLKSDTLRFYERAGLMPKAERTAGGYRAYGPDAVERLHFIRKAQALGFSLDQIKRILRLRQSGSLPCDYVIELAEQRLKETDQELTRLEQFRTALGRYVRHWKRTASHDACAATQFCNLIEEIDVAVANVPANSPVRASLKK